MSTGIISAPPPFEIIAEFLGALHSVVGNSDRLVPVLRGSTLMRHWFGAGARPAADIDLEWFPLRDWTAGRFQTPLAHARCLCMFAMFEADDTTQPVFDPDMPVPADGVNLWDYDTPGVRCYTGWYWTDRGLSGHLQIDIAQPGLYDLESITTRFVELPRPNGGVACVRSYTPEMLLAAKLSWILRGVRAPIHSGGLVVFNGQPKDVFDAHLLVTAGQLRGSVFMQSLMSVVLEDRLSWSQVEEFMDQDCDRLAGAEFAQGQAFIDQHSPLMKVGLDEMLSAVVQGSAQLCHDFRQHIAFFRSIESQTDEASLQVYADWLEERMDPRSDFLRRCCRFLFHSEMNLRAELNAQIGRFSTAWLAHALGGIENLRRIRY